MRAVESAELEEGRGIVGDRYHAGEGSWTARDEPHRDRRQLTLIEREAIDAVRRDHGIDLTADLTRRNIVTAGVALNDLVGAEFSVGGARVRGVQLCEPCNHLQELAGLPILEPLVHRGGLNCEVLGSGTVTVGDAVET